MKKGLVVAMTFVGTELKDIKYGFNSVFIVRYLLEKANNSKEAIDLLMELPVASNCNILISDSSGDMCVVECTPQKKYIRELIIVNKDLKFICTVNSFISENMKKYEWTKEETYQSEERYWNVVNAMLKYKEEDIIVYIKNILKGKYGFMCQYEKHLNFETIWSSIFDLKSLKIYRAEENPSKKTFIEDERLQKIK